MKKDKNAENGGKPVADPGWSRNRVCQKSGDHRKRKEPGDFASDSFFSERRDPMRQQFSSRRIPGDCSKNQWIFWDNPSGCRTGNGRHRRQKSGRNHGILYTKKFLSGKSRRVAEERRNGDSSDSWAQTWLS